MRWPRAPLAEFGTIIAPAVGIRVCDSTTNMRYLVLPMRPTGTEARTEDQLAAIATRDAMIGMAVPKAAVRSGTLWARLRGLV